MARGVAIAALIVLGAAVCVLVFSPPAPHGNPVATTLARPSATPTASTSPAPLHDYGPPPSGIPLIYAADPNNLLWITAFDWQGHALGTIRLKEPLQTDLVPEQHCVVLGDPQTYDEVLYTFLPGQKLKRVGVIYNEGAINQSGVDAVGCSFPNDLAIAVHIGVTIPIETWAVRLSDGTILGHWSYTYGDVEEVVPSSDGKLIAENSRYASRIRSIPDGAVVATLPMHVFAFSDDDRLILTGPTESPAAISLVDWRTGLPASTYRSAGWPVETLVRPGSGDVAVAVGTEDQYHGVSQDISKSIVILQSSGGEIDLPGKCVPLFPPYADAGYVGKGGQP